MLRRRARNTRQGMGIIAITAIILVASALVLSVMSLNVSQVSMTESSIKSLQARSLAEGYLAYVYENLSSDSAGNAWTFVDSIDGVSFTSNITVGTAVKIIFCEDEAA